MYSVFKYLYAFLIISIAIIFFNKDNSSEYPNDKISPNDKLFLFAHYEYLKIRDPKTKQIPTNIRLRELQFAKDNKNQQWLKSGLKTSSFDDLVWTNQGPDNVGGRTLCLSADIRDNNILFAGTASGGLWRTIDGGGNWTKVTLPNDIQSIRSIQQDTRAGNEDTWYYGTGEFLSTGFRKTSNYPRTVSYGGGIYKSSDNGITWSLLESTGNGVEGSFNDNFQCVWRIVTDPFDENDVVLAACYGGIMRSDDGGETWRNVLGDIDNPNFSSYIDISADGKYFAVLSNHSGILDIESRGGIFTSLNGIDWVEITPPGFPMDTRNVKIEISDSDPSVFYVLTESMYLPNVFYSSVHSFWKCEIRNGEYNWYDRSNFLVGGKETTFINEKTFNTLGGYCIFLKIDPQNPDRIFLGGTNLFISEDGGQSWNNAGGYPDYRESGGLHPDQHDLIFVDNNLVVSNDGGIYTISQNNINSTAWKTINNNLNGTQFYSVAIDEFTPESDFIIGGLQDNYSQYRFLNRSNNWSFRTGGDGMTAKVGKDLELVISSAQNGHLYLAKYVNGNFQSIANFKPDFVGQQYYSNFFTIFDITHDNNTVYVAAYNNLLAATDIRQMTGEWQSQQFIDVTDDILPTDEMISALHVPNNETNDIIVGTAEGNLIYIKNSLDQFPIYLDITSQIFPNGGFISAIETDDFDTDRIFVTFSNYNVQSIFYSEDRGLSWIAIGGTLEQNPDGTGAGPSVRDFNHVRFENEDYYFVATSTGLYGTKFLNGDETYWEQLGSKNVGFVQVESIAARNIDGRIVIGTYGNGVYTADLIQISDTNLENDNKNILSFAFPNPAQQSLNIDITLPFTGFAKIEILNSVGKLVQSLPIEYYQYGSYRIDVNVSKFSSGSYFYRIIQNGKQHIGKFLVER